MRGVDDVAALIGAPSGGYRRDFYPSVEPEKINPIGYRGPGAHASPVTAFTAQVIVDQNLRFSQVLVHNDAFLPGNAPRQAADVTAG